MTWRLAKSLEQMRTQVNLAHPRRSKISDGTIGDTRHKQNKSDHNENPAGIVCALDLTHDLDKKGDDFDGWKFAETLRLSRDPRIAYVISNGQIFSGPDGKAPWVWRTYTGPNKHAHHTHVSVRQDAKYWDDPRPWNLSFPGVVVPPAPVIPPPPGVTMDVRRQMARMIVGYEARRDAAGNLMIYHPRDGSFEVAGINSASHPTLAGRLKTMVETKQFGAAEKAAEDFILDYTKVVTGWVTDAGLEFMLRDSVLNRGPTGGATILQMALGVEADGQIGQVTRAKLATESPIQLLAKLRAARDQYERQVMKRTEADPVWKGMVNRWDKSLKDALIFQKKGQLPVGGTAAKGTVAGGSVVTGTVIAGTAAKKPIEQGGGFDWGLMIPIIVVALSIAAVAWFIWPNKEGETTK